jgi:uncharacterized protein (DUF58 family)
MALTRKAIAYLVTGYAFIFLALLLRTAWLTVFMLPIAILVSLPSRIPKSEAIPLAITRRIQPRRSIGDEDIDVILTVTNTSRYAIDGVQLEDNIPDDLKLRSGTNRLILSVRPGEAVEFKYRIAAPKRGSYVVGPTLIHFEDNLGFRESTSRLSNIDEFIVLPKIEDVGILDLKARRLGPWPGLIPSRRIGIGTEFFEISPYVPGDDLRRVNWKASARSRQLVTNDYEGEHVTDVLVVLDCSEGVMSGLFDFDVLEFQVSLAGSLCSQLIMQGNRVGISIYGAVRTWVDLAFGKRQLLRILDNLAIVRPGPASLPINYVVDSVITALLPARSVVVMISPIISDEVADLIENITAKGYNMVCFTPSIRADIRNLKMSSSVARRIFATERRLRIIRVSKRAHVIEVSPTTPIKPVLRMRGRWSKT